MIDDDVETRLHSALDELTEAVELRHPDEPRTTTATNSYINSASDILNGSGTDNVGTSGHWRHSGWADPKLLVLAACVLVLLVGLGLAGLRHAHRHHSSTTASTSTSIPSPATTLPPTTTTTVPAVVPSTTSLPISVESDSAMQAAGNNGPSSSVLTPSSCVLSGDTVTAIGTYQGGFAPNVYNRYGDVVVLYIFGAPSSGYPQGAQLGASSVTNSPAIGSGTWQTSATVDLSTGQPVRCVVAAQPTHDVQLAP
jgi:hypothetical protein